MPIIASMSGFPRCHTFRVRGVLERHKVTVLIDGGASHNFIDATLVDRRRISTEEFDGFAVAIPSGHQMDCTRYVPKLKLTMGNYIVVDDLFIVDVPETNVVLGVQWLYYIRSYTTVDLG